MQTATQPRTNGAHAQHAEPPPQANLLDSVIGATAVHRYSIAEMEIISKKAAASGMFNAGGEDGSRPLTPDQAFMFGLIAEALNMPYALVLMRFEIVMGKPSMKTAYVMAEYQRQGGTIEWIETTDERVSAVFTSKRHPKPFALELTLKELCDRKIAMRYDKDGRQWVMKNQYKNNPRPMLRYRCVTEAVRATDPGILMGFYSEIEAADFEASDAPTEQAVEKRNALVETLNKRRETPKDNRPSVAEVVAEVKAAQESQAETPKSPQADPQSEWGKMIADTTEEANKALAELAEQNPSRLELRKSLAVQTVINGVLKAFVGRNLLNEDGLKTDGKRDRQKVADAMQFLWDDDRDDLESVVAKYIGEKITEAMGPPKAATSAA